jgi:CDP-paratose 2-epimerase
MRWLRGRAFNIGGGPSNTLSLLELLDLAAQLCGRRSDVRFGAWRAGDQRYYVSNTAAFSSATAWRPRVAPAAGIQALFGWLLQQRGAALVPHLEGAAHA